MDYFQRLINQSQIRLLVVIFINNLNLVLLFFGLSQLTKLKLIDIVTIVLIAGIAEAMIAAIWLSNYLLQPTKVIWQSILRLSPDSKDIPAPKIDKLSLGKEFTTNITSQIYQLINVANQLEKQTSIKLKNLSGNFIATNLPLPLVVLDQTETIKFVNQAFADYINMASEDLIGKNIYSILDMSFQSEDTFDNWLKSIKANSAKASQHWERVKLDVRDSHPVLIFDLAAYYNRDNPDKNETMLVLFDHTKLYSQEDQAVSFMALSVHELRSPLTLLRGYIEVFKEELEPSLSDELKNFMDKMLSQLDILMAYVNNILNVARVDDDQLELKLVEEEWPSILRSTVEALKIRAKVRGISINCKIAPDLPTVGIDRISIQEVINNLIDNAIKYSVKSKVINVESHYEKNGFVVTTIQDFGSGISTSVIPNLFSKFYRDHRNRAQVGGTGLGLYLSKAIVNAHGGNLWVKSQEGKGSIFGFTIQEYSNLKHGSNESENDLIRNAHGWIKNHSLYRR
ncbi:MAG TPA: PAS domain-containing sensor histidine kinase [Patescibacteria group bacterium]|nr:PAS domain-containing sensor histidine kinase [Patescibacteria group bacterium]